MATADNKLQTKQNPIRALWPDVNTEKGQAEAIKAGAVALGYIAVSYAIGTAFIISAGEDLFGTFENQTELIATLTLNVAGIVVAPLLAWTLYKRQNRIVAFIGLGWVALEVVMKLIAAPGRGVVIAVLALLFSINGVRGALASKSKREEAPAEA